jgi:type IV pilus assembly protein PilW
MCASNRHRPRAGQRGLSIVEIMVGMVIALLVSLAASSTASIFTASQRQGVGAGGMAVNAGTALAALKSDVASAGLGFFGDSTFLCYTLDLSTGASVKLDGASFSPVRITSDGTNDSLEVLYATSVDSGANVLLSGTSNGTSASVQSLLPATAVAANTNGQAVLLAPGSPGNTCMVRTITAITDSTATTPQSLTFTTYGKFNGGAFAATPTFSENNKDRVALLGDLRWSRYRLSSGNLTLERPLDGTSAVLVRNVMSFRAQYGIVGTASNATTLSGWQDATAGSIWASVSGANVERIRALRIGMVTRSAQPEKPNASGVCEASTTMPTDPLNPSVTVTPDVTNWQCWRYRSVVVVVPLRNLVW